MLRAFAKSLLAALFVLTALPAQAEACHGRNLISALPPVQLDALKARAEVPFAHGNLWTATKDGRQITLAGTYHLADPRLDGVLAALAPSLAAATTLLVEAGPQEEIALKAAIARNPALMQTTGPALPDLLAQEEWQKLAAAFQARGIAPQVAGRMQPWLLSTLLAVPACMFPLAAGYDQGLDKRLIALAEARHLPVQSLEPFDTIFGVFARFKDTDQIALLTQGAAQDASSDDMTATLADSYFAGESRLFWAFSRDQMLTLPGSTPASVDAQVALMERAMITTRNAAWIPVLTTAAARGPVLAAFGALHLSGEAGVLNLLARDGWTVAPLAP
jgi:uncharacterized protein YbaP (TraB family)